MYNYHSIPSLTCFSNLLSIASTSFPSMQRPLDKLLVVNGHRQIKPVDFLIVCHDLSPVRAILMSNRYYCQVVRPDFALRASDFALGASSDKT